MRRAEWASGDADVVIGVVDQAGSLEQPARALGGVDAQVVSGDVDTVLERSPAFVVCVGADAVSAVARDDGEAVPILAVDAGDGLPSVTAAALADALEATLRGDVHTHSVPVLSVESDALAAPARAVFDVALLTDEPARISEYSVVSDGEHVAQFRADGVVVATPQGSHGYASAAGGPLVSADLDAVAVVPVAPFVTHTREWILPDDYLELTVERDESTVVVETDERVLEPIPVSTPVTVRAAETCSLLTPTLE
ncbi:diacylglycerol kinase catalytic domain-containing protein [Natronobiforma cellulositropha]|uniref:NAD(+)/NADH kinase n=1 Tax=Natronobiforma cellulositropha TaxID=1679076 RepID=UPI0021D5CAF5|nr:NAD(+)/NADH kinase [Natronobiforma cellulositropha]